MIKLITRNQAFADNKAFESLAYDWQLLYDQQPTQVQEYQIGDKVWDDGKQEYYTVTSNEELTVLNTKYPKEVIGMHRDRLVNHNVEFSPKHKYIANYDNARKYFQQVGTFVNAMLTYLKEDSITMLSLWPVYPWLHRETEYDYQPIIDSFEYLRKIGVSKNFIGGIQASGDDISELLYQYSWATDNAFNYCYFKFGKSHLIGYICKNGDIELVFGDEITGEEVDLIAESCEMKKIQECTSNKYFEIPIYE